MKLIILLSTLSALIGMTGCTERNKNGDIIVNNVYHKTCVYGTLYIVASKRLSIMLNDDGTPIKCSMVVEQQ